MSGNWHILIPNERRLRLVAEIMATKLTAGDLVALHGDLGAGKSTLCRYLIRAMLGDDAADVPSPTFTLMQSYETSRFEVRHFDLYRISGVDELDELGFDDRDGECVTLVEWPDRAGSALPSQRFDVSIAEPAGVNAANTLAASFEARELSITSAPEAAFRLGRMKAAYDFLVDQFDADARDALRLSFLQGDASPRGYATAKLPEQPSQLLMDMPKLPDGPVIRDGKTYSEIAHLAEDAVPFIAIASELRRIGLSAPEVYAFDAPHGMALIEDLGPLTYAEALAQGVAKEMLWHVALDALVTLRNAAPPSVAVGASGETHRMPLYDADVLMSEADLLPSWYWPYAHDQSIDASKRKEFEALWRPLIDDVAAHQEEPGGQCWVLRDYHSPNLIWLPDRTGVQRVGIIDFQDAQIGHAAYDVASLAQDARLDVSRCLHDALLNSYCERVAKTDAAFDEAGFRRAFAILGAQRNTKILGIFVRLSVRDGKHGYLRHIPRIRRYLSWCLEHPELAALKSWYEDAKILCE